LCFASLLLLAAPLGVTAQTPLVEAKTAGGAEVATIRTDSMRVLVPLRVLGMGVSAGFLAADDSARIGGEGSFLATGTFDAATLVTPPAAGAGTRMMWYPEMASFRAGYVDGTQWDKLNVGESSTAGGHNVTASGTSSTAFGEGSTASGFGATALGQSNTASGYDAFAGGYNGSASGAYSVALGGSANAGGNFAFAAGGATNASNDYAVALGSNTIASGNASFAAGTNAVASGMGAISLGAATSATADLSIALGGTTAASGTYAVATGQGTSAQAYNSFVVGRYNTLTGTTGSWVSTEPLFVAGNGSSGSSRSDALVLLKNGDMTIAGTLTQSSDARLKEDMEPLTGVLERVMQLTPIRYRFRPGAGHPAGEQIGLTAQQVRPLFPELVKTDADGYLSLSYANLSAVLVRAVQEQQAEIDAVRDGQAATASLKAEVRSLRERNEKLASEIAALRARQAEILRRLGMAEPDGGR